MEKYGTIPKKFTKAWWEYFWEYYKWHTISIAFIIFMVSSLTYSIVTATKYDAYVSYVGKSPTFMVSKESLKELITPLTEEITENETIDISFDEYSLDATVEPEASEVEMESAISMKLMAELEAGDSYLFLISKNNLDGFHGLSDCFVDTSVYAEGAENVYTDENGRACAVSLEGNEKLTAAGVDCTDMYLAVRALYERDRDSEQKPKLYENSLKIAKFIIGE